MRRRQLLDTDELIKPQVSASVDALGLGPEHAGMVKLALIYAAAIDAGALHCSGCDDPECKRADRSWAVRWIGPNLHAALESLGASPAAKAAIDKAKGAPKADAPPSQLDRLRQARNQGKRT